jgi:hypothetical protein
LLFETGKYQEAKKILLAFNNITSNNKRTINFRILSLFTIFTINILTFESDEIFATLKNLQNAIEDLKIFLEEEFKKVNFESVIKIF